MRTNFLPVAESAPTTRPAFSNSRLHAPGGWLALLAALLFSTSAVLPAETGYQKHVSQKKRYLVDVNKFDKDRRAQITRQSQERFGASEKLSADEQRIALRLSNHVAAYITNHRANPWFGPMRPFYEVKEEIARTPAYQLLTNMPKGALLHAHLTAIGRVDWVVSKALTMPNCYVKWPSSSAAGNQGQLKFFTPEEAAMNADYSLVAQKMAEFPAQGSGSFSNALRTALLFDQDNAGPGKQPWREFDKLRGLTGDFIRNRSVFTNYLLDAFETLWNDGVYYVELRDSLGNLNTLNQQAGSEDDYFNNFKHARDMMKAKHPEFDCRLILSGYRGSDANAIVGKLRKALELRGPDDSLIVGFDLIGEESGDTNLTTRAKVADVQKRIASDPACVALTEKLWTNKDLPYFLHDGESAWADNDNLIDAVMLATPRIGHGFNLYRFPNLYREIKARDIALEICPISNQLLGLSPDLRTHPAAGYLNAGIQCVLASDDPLFFGNDGLSYDFWEALVAWNLDLAALKKLARNSITYSGLDAEPKTRLMKHWEREWDKFIRRLAQEKPQL
jgi:adenosine deaminase CECR1